MYSLVVCTTFSMALAEEIYGYARAVSALLDNQLVHMILKV